MEKIIDVENDTNHIKPRNRVVAFLLSALLPGLGQVYNGQLKKGILLFALLLLFPVVFGLVNAASSFYGMVVLLIIQLTIRMYAVVDGVKNASRQQDYILKSYNTWFAYLLIGGGMFAILTLYDTSTITGIKTFKIPTASNSPTIQLGDWLVADMRAYQDKAPDYGDLVVFSKPDGLVYAFRVVGKPNDEIAIVDNIVRVNGKLSPTKIIAELKNIDGIETLKLEETLPNGHQHLMYKFEQPGNAKSNVESTQIPPDSYYLLGDNRDQALDSRYEGFVKAKSIQGKIIYSYWGQTTDRINIDFSNK